MTADEEGWIEGMSDFHISFDDAWSRMFVMILGTAMPDSTVKNHFLAFVTEWSMDADGCLSATENDIINLFPEFLNTLVGGQYD